MINFIEGDLIKLAKDNEFDVIMHGCNCFNTMGAGIAKDIAYHFPNALLADQNTIKADKNKLGTYSIGYDDSYKLHILNLYTQYQYNRKVVDLFEYDAFTTIMKKLNSNSHYHDKKIGMPMIGAGLAHGDWERVLEIVESNSNNLDITIVKYKKNGY